MGIKVLRIEATEDGYRSRITAHHQLFVGSLTWLDGEGAHIDQYASTSQSRSRDKQVVTSIHLGSVLEGHSP